jgi:hypothetical protein
MSASFFSVQLLPLELGERRAQLHHLGQLADFLLQLGHPAAQFLFLLVRFLGGPARRLLLLGCQHRLQGASLPLVIALAREAQLPGRLGGRHPAGLDFHDQQGALLGLGLRAAHARALCRDLRRAGNLGLLELG